MALSAAGAPTRPSQAARAVPAGGPSRRKARIRGAWAVVLAAGILCPAVLEAQSPTVRARGQAIAPRAGAVQANSRGWFGFSYAVTREGRAGRVVREVVAIQSVVAGSPADRGGLRSGDVLVRIGGEDATGRVLQRRADGVHPGDTLRVAVRRGGETREIEMVAAARPNGLRAISGTGGRLFLLDSLQSRAQIVLDSIRSNVLHVRAQVRETAPGAEVEFIVRDGAGEERRVRFQPQDADALRRFRESLALQQRAAPTRIVIEDAENAHTDVRRALREIEEIRIQRAQELETMSAWRSARGSGRGVSVAPAPGYGISIATASFGVAGAELTPMRPQMRPYFGVDDGLLVIRVGTGTPAARAGLREGDVVIAAEDRPVSNVTDIARAISSARGEGLDLSVVRERKRLLVRIPGP